MQVQERNTTFKMNYAKLEVDVKIIMGRDLSGFISLLRV